MSVWKSSGVLKYDPRAERGTFRPHWVILQCDKELVRYYQHIFYTLHHKKLQTAMWSSHCSLVRGEKPNITNAWKKFDSKVIEFSYSYDGEFFSNDRHYWIRCWSEKDEFGDIRESLGLSREPLVPYHISIGSLNQ